MATGVRGCDTDTAAGASVVTVYNDEDVNTSKRTSPASSKSSTNGKNRENESRPSGTGSDAAIYGNGYVANKYVILVSACLVFGINAGYFLSFGVLFGDILETFNDSRSQAASIQSMFTAVELCSSLPIGYLVNKYGSRRCGVTGCVLTSVGIMGCFLSTSTLYLQILISVVAGFGFSFFFLSGIQVVSEHFEGASRMTSLSILLSAPSAAGLIYPLLLRYLCDTFGLLWTFLLTGALTLNSIPLAWVWIAADPHTSTDDIIKHDTGEVNGCNTVCHDTINSARVETAECVQEKQHQVKIYKNSLSNFNKGIKGNAPYQTRGCLYGSIAAADSSNGVVEHSSFQFLELDLAPSSYLLPISYCSKYDIEGAFPVFKVDDIPNCMVTHQLLRNTPYVLFTLGQTMAQTALVMVSVFTVDILTEKCFTLSNASTVVLVFNLLSLPGRLLPGFAKGTQRIKVNPFTSVIAATFIGSLSVMCFLLTNDLGQVTICFGLAGFAHGCIISSNSVTVTTLVPSRYFTPAVGSIFGILGVAVGMAGPISGIIREVYGSYDVMIIFMSSAIFLGFVLFTSAMVIKSRETRPVTRLPTVDGA